MMKRFVYIVFAAVAFAFAPFPAAGQNETLSPSEARRQSRLFDEHIVRMGETAYSIARGYAISPLTLAEDNPDIPLTQVRAGQILLIRKKERGRTNSSQVAREWQEMADRAAQTYSQAGGWTPDEGVRGLPQETSGQPASDTLWSPLGAPGGAPDDRTAGWGYGRDAAENRREARDFSLGGTPRIALMLPFSGTGANPAGNDFTNFYKGALLALEDLKAGGRSAAVTVYDSGAAAEKVENIITSAEFIDSDLIIGPVFENELAPAVRFGDYFGVPVVSPLAPVQSLDGEFLYQMAPGADTKYDKLRPLWEGDANVIVVSSGAADDAEFRREIEAELGARNYGRFTVGQGNVASLVDWERPNVFVVLAGNEQAVNMSLATISSSYSNASARRGRRADIAVVGTSKWVGYNVSLDQNLLFKLNVNLVTNYYINRFDDRTRLFEARYVETYGDLPSKAAFRGYDAVALFAGALFERGFSFADRLERVGDAPLGTPYGFARAGDGTSRRVNDQWTLVSFSSDYNITTR